MAGWRRCRQESAVEITQPGTIKLITAGGRLPTRDLEGTRIEMALSFLSYNIFRAINPNRRCLK